MKIKLSLISILLLLGVHIFAQEIILRVKEHGSRKYSYVNEKGEPLSGKQYFSAIDFCEEGVGIVSLTSNIVYKLIDTNEEFIETNYPVKPIINEWTQKPSGFRSGMLRTKVQSKLGAFNTEGKLTVPSIYDKLTEFDGNYSLGSMENKHFVIKNDGSQIPIEIEKIKDFKHFSEGLAPIRKGKKWGYVDTLGQMSIPAKFKSVGYFNGGIAWAKHLNGLVGYINKSGEWIIEPYYAIGMDYDEISGLARVKSNLGWGYINMKNEFNKLGVGKTFHNFYEGLAVRHRGRIGYMDNTGNLLIKAQFKTAHRFRNGYARVQINENWGIIDKEGNWVIEPKYKEVGEAIKLIKK